MDVSILTANYNNGRYLDKFIVSITESTVLPRELIIVDDGSRDDSFLRLQRHALELPFLKVIGLPWNVGFANALNEGLSVVTGKYVMRVDSDDYVAPIRLERQYEFLESNPDVDIVGSNITYFDSSSEERVFHSNVPLEHKRILKVFQGGSCGVIHGSIMCKSAVMKRFKYDQKNVPAEDYQLFSSILKEGCRVCNLSESLTFVRIHVDSVSNNLPYDTIRKTFDLKKTIWGTETHWLTVRRMHLYLYHYRKFLFTRGGKKFIYLFLSVLFNPSKLWARILTRGSGNEN